MPEEQPSPIEPQPVQPVSFVERNNIHPILFAIGCLFIVFVLYQLVAGTVTVIAMGGTKVTRENVSLTRFLTMVGQIVFIFGPTLLFARLLSSRMPEVFPWRIPSIRESIYALLGLVWLQQIFQIYLFFQQRVPLPDAIKRVLDPLREMMEEMYKGLVTAESIPELAFVLLVVAFVPAIVEELLFRGVIQRTFERMATPLRAAIITGVIFGFFHFNPFTLLPLIGLGCYFGFLRMRSNSIILAMTAHFLNNTLAVIVVYFGMDEEKMVTMGDVVQPTTPTVIFQLMLFLMLFVLSIMAYLRATTDLSHRESQE